MKQNKILFGVLLSILTIILLSVSVMAEINFPDGYCEQTFPYIISGCRADDGTFSNSNYASLYNNGSDGSVTFSYGNISDYLENVTKIRFNVRMEEYTNENLGLEFYVYNGSSYIREYVYYGSPSNFSFFVDAEDYLLNNNSEIITNYVLLSNNSVTPYGVTSDDARLYEVDIIFYEFDVCDSSLTEDVCYLNDTLYLDALNHNNKTIFLNGNSLYLENATLLNSRLIYSTGERVSTSSSINTGYFQGEIELFFNNGRFTTYSTQTNISLINNNNNFGLFLYEDLYNGDFDSGIILLSQIFGGLYDNNTYNFIHNQNNGSVYWNGEDVTRRYRWSGLNDNGYNYYIFNGSLDNIQNELIEGIDFNYRTASSFGGTQNGTLEIEIIGGRGLTDVSFSDILQNPICDTNLNNSPCNIEGFIALSYINVSDKIVYLNGGTSYFFPDDNSIFNGDIHFIGNGYDMIYLSQSRDNITINANLYSEESTGTPYLLITNITNQFFNFTFINGEYIVSVNKDEGQYNDDQIIAIQNESLATPTKINGTITNEDFIFGDKWLYTSMIANSYEFVFDDIRNISNLTVYNNGEEQIRGIDFYDVLFYWYGEFGNESYSTAPNESVATGLSFLTFKNGNWSVSEYINETVIPEDNETTVSEFTFSDDTKDFIKNTLIEILLLFGAIVLYFESIRKTFVLSKEKNDRILNAIMGILALGLFFVSGITGGLIVLAVILSSVIITLNAIENILV